MGLGGRSSRRGLSQKIDKTGRQGTCLSRGPGAPGGHILLIQMQIAMAGVGSGPGAGPCQSPHRGWAVMTCCYCYCCRARDCSKGQSRAGNSRLPNESDFFWRNHCLPDLIKFHWKDSFAPELFIHSFFVDLRNKPLISNLNILVGYNELQKLNPISMSITLFCYQRVYTNTNLLFFFNFFFLKSLYSPNSSRSHQTVIFFIKISGSLIVSNSLGMGQDLFPLSGTPKHVVMKSAHELLVPICLYIQNYVSAEWF